ncbi:DUF7344 domain-containing protein [Haloarchaeobius sp. HRN-SO-5]|uniref:DUF7344 domain-containing protein n=1 Tax=Haloarchaeobius sp. HRN-SO-5 TaxID=3446118 RepID=UPI003EC136B9
MSTHGDAISGEKGESLPDDSEGEDVAQTQEESGAEQTEDEPESETLPLDIVFEIIRNERRRLVLQYLDEIDEDEVTLSDLAEHIAAIENDTTVQSLSAQQRKRVYVGLYQCHLPKMADSGIVDFNKNRGIIRPGANIDQLEPYLDIETEEESPMGYIALASIAVVTYALAAFGGFAGQLAGGFIIFSMLVLFVLVGMRQVRDSRAD